MSVYSTIGPLVAQYLKNKDVNEYSDIRIFAFHSNIRIRFPNSNIRFFTFLDPTVFDS